MSRSWKGALAVGLFALTTACGGAAQEGTIENGQGAAPALAAAAKPGTAPVDRSGASVKKQALASANPLAPIVTESGFISLSLDAAGTNGPSAVVQVNKPAGATVKAAYLAAASKGFSGYSIPNNEVRLDGVGVGWHTTVQSGINSWNHWADVTNMVKAKIDAAPTGRVNFTLTEANTAKVDGEILAVVFNNPAATTVNTVILLFGAQSTGGDTFRIGLAEPINKNDPNLGLDLSLGISFGYQEAVANEIQVSLIDVNGQRLTSQAGGQDDGASEDGALITVGGLDDTNANPNPTSRGPGFRSDDELYDLRPFVANGATQITVFTQNPSNDDNIFFAALSLTSAAAVVGEGIVLGPTASSGPVGSTHTVTATLQDDNGQPLVNRTVTFKVRTGPNANTTGTATTNSQGKANFSYAGNGGAGRDDIQATFVKANGQTGTSNSAFRDWVAVNQAPTVSCTNVVLDAGPSCGASGSIFNGATDAEDGDNVNCVESPAGPYGPGTTTVTLTCTDSQGASASCTGTVTVNDTTAPVITCPADQVAECVNNSGTANVSMATATDNCGSPVVPGSVPSTFQLGTTIVRQTAYDSVYNAAICTSTVIVQDTQAPQLAVNAGPATIDCNPNGYYADPGATATDVCNGDLTSAIVTSGSVNPAQSGQYTITYSVSDSSGNASTASRQVTVGPCDSGCVSLNLSDYNLFLEGDYTGGHDVVGKVAAGGNISMTNFAVGSGLAANDIANTLVAGGNLTLAHGALWGDTVYGGNYSADVSVTSYRGTVSQGTPIDFAARFTELRSLSATLAGLTVNGTTTRENWGGVMLSGNDPSMNVFDVQASAFNGAKLLSITAPAGSLAVVNIRGASATFTAFGHSFNGGIDQHGVVYNFVDATSINAHGYGFWGTVLAPNADVTFNDGSWDGGIYAKSLTGNAEGHINALGEHQVCPENNH